MDFCGQKSSIPNKTSFIKHGLTTPSTKSFKVQKPEKKGFCKRVESMSTKYQSQLQRKKSDFLVHDKYKLIKASFKK